MKTLLKLIFYLLLPLILLAVMILALALPPDGELIEEEEPSWRRV